MLILRRAAAAAAARGRSRLVSAAGFHLAVDTAPVQTVAPGNPAKPAEAATVVDPPRPVLPLNIVTSERVRSTLPWIGNAAYVMLASGFLMTDIFYLRCLLTVGYGALTVYHVLQLRPLRIPLSGSAFFVLVNFGMAVMLFRERYLTLDEEEGLLYKEHFEATLSISDFKKLMGHAKLLRPMDRVELMRAGEKADVILVLEGRAEVQPRGRPSVFVERRGLLGEVSFVSGGPTSLSAVAVPGSLYAVWPRDELRQLLFREPSLQKGLELKIGREIMRKLQTDTWVEANIISDISRGWWSWLRASSSMRRVRDDE